MLIENLWLTFLVSLFENDFFCIEKNEQFMGTWVGQRY